VADAARRRGARVREAAGRVGWAAPGRAVPGRAAAVALTQVSAGGQRLRDARPTRWRSLARGCSGWPGLGRVRPGPGSGACSPAPAEHRSGLRWSASGHETGDWHGPDACL